MFGSFGRSTAARLGVPLLVVLLALSSTASGQWTYTRGDANADGSNNIADAISTLGFLFQGGPSVCQDAMDANDSGAIDIADAVFLLDTLFGGGGIVPPAPYPDCGEDPTADALDCVGPVTGCSAVPTGCVVNGECPTGQYCEKAVGDCNGTGSCVAMPFICPLIFDPVCGCDGNTYDNSCNAAAVGVNVELAGPCPVAGCTDNGQCPTGQYCEKAVGDCNGTGSCIAMPFICPLIFDPVCGCDGNTYDNSCIAASVGVNVETAGPCPVAGCTDNGQCPTGQYCSKAVGDCNGIGSCATMPFICSLIFDPVCGCDGNTYSNACVAASVGMNVETLGVCP